MKGRWVGWAVFIVIIAVVIGLAVSGNARTNTLIESALAGKPDAIKTLGEREDYYDLLQGRPKEGRIRLAKALQSIGDENAVKMAIRMSRDPEKEVRDTLTETLTAIGPKNIKVLADGLKEGDTNIKSVVVQAMVNIGQPSIVPAAELLKDGGGRSSAGDVLVKLSAVSPDYRAQAVTAMLPLVDDADEAIRLFAIETLGKIGDHRAAGPIAKHLNDNPRSRRVVVGALGSIAAPESEGILVAAVRDENEDPDARAQAALGLGKVAGPTAVQTLVTALDDVDLRVRNSAVVGLQTAGARVVGALGPALGSNDPELRARAVEALGGATRDPAALSRLGAALRDPDARVRMAAVRALGMPSSVAQGSESYSPQQVSLLVTALSDRDGAVATEASEQLGRVGSPAVGPLVAQLDSPEETNAYFAAEALGRIGAPAVQPLSARLNNRWAVVALGRMRDAQVRPLLEQAAQSPNEDISHVAAEALAANFGVTQ